MNEIVAFVVYIIAVLTAAWVSFIFYRGYNDEDGDRL